jgi:hypothetical protein
MANGEAFLQRVFGGGPEGAEDNTMNLTPKRGAAPYFQVHALSGFYFKSGFQALVCRKFPSLI